MRKWMWGRHLKSQHSVGGGGAGGLGAQGHPQLRTVTSSMDNSISFSKGGHLHRSTEMSMVTWGLERGLGTFRTGLRVDHLQVVILQSQLPALQVALAPSQLRQSFRAPDLPHHRCQPLRSIPLINRVKIQFTSMS